MGRLHRINVFLLALLAFAWFGFSSAASAHGITQAQMNAAIDNITGTNDAGHVASEQLCPKPKPGFASCDLQVLILKGNRKIVHPNLERAYSTDRTVVRHTSPFLASPFSFASPLVAQPSSEPAAAVMPQSGTPAFFQQAYDLSYLSQTQGANETIGIVDAYEDPTAASDLATYRSEYGLPACTTANGCLTISNTATTTDSSWEDETSLDLETVSAICPLCKIALIETPSASWSDLYAGIAEAHTLGANEISNSWGGPVSPGDGPGSSGLSYTNTGTLFGSGDWGYGYEGGVQYPAAYSNVTAIGGTTLTYTPTNPRGFTEVAWNGLGATGSGCDTSVAKPVWQTGDNTGCAGRSYNDISADADPGMLVYDSGECSNWCVIGGTSEATPMTAAYYALLGIGPGPSWPYTNAASLNDVTSGSNVMTFYGDPTCPTDPGICNAGPGFDGPTGNGTISGDVAVGAPGIGSNGNGAASVSGTTYTATAGVYPNGADTKVWIEYGSTTSFGQTTAQQDIGSGTSAQSVSLTLKGLTNAQAVYYRVVAQNSYGTTYGYAVTVNPPTISSTPGWPSIFSFSLGTPGATYVSYNMNADLGTNGTMYFEYGPTSAYGTAVNEGTFTGYMTGGPFVTGLAGDTTYHYSFVVTNSFGTVSTADSTFTTSTGVVVSVGSATGVYGGSATVHGSVNPEDGTCAFYFEYGTSTAYGNQTASTPCSVYSPFLVSAHIINLAPNTTYHYAVVGTGSGETKTSADQTFTTGGSGGGTARAPVSTPTITLKSLTTSSSASALTVVCRKTAACTVKVVVVQTVGKHKKALKTYTFTVRSGAKKALTMKLSKGLTAKKGVSLSIQQTIGGKTLTVATASKKLVHGRATFVLAKH